MVRWQVSETATESRIARFQVIRRRPSIKAPVNRGRFSVMMRNDFPWTIRGG
jgi:hypothetical protein